MDLDDFLKPENVVCDLRAASKKLALQDIANRAANVTGLAEREIFDTLLERERLGSTAVGHGIAIPHGKLSDLNYMFGLVAKLDHPIDFDAADDQLVDIIFLLLAPEAAGADHLKALAKVSRLLRDDKICEQLRQSPDADKMYQSIIGLPSAP